MNTYFELSCLARNSGGLDYFIHYTIIRETVENSILFYYIEGNHLFHGFSSYTSRAINMNNIKLYIFDMGGVVSTSNNVLPSIADHLGITVSEFYKMVEDIAYPMMRGEHSSESFWHHTSQRLGIEIKEDLFGLYFHLL